MKTSLQIVLPVMLPRALILWVLIRLMFATLPLAAGAGFGSLPPTPAGVVCLTAAASVVDVNVRGERVLWGNLAVTPLTLAGVYAATALAAEVALMLVLR